MRGLAAALLLCSCGPDVFPAVALHPKAEVSPAELSFGFVAQQSRSRRRVSLRNVGDPGSVLQLLGTGLERADPDLSVTAELFEVEVELAPSRSGDHANALLIRTNAGDVRVPVYGEAGPTLPVLHEPVDPRFSVGCLNVYPGDFDFGTVMLGCESHPASFHFDASCAGVVVVGEPTDEAFQVSGRTATELTVKFVPKFYGAVVAAVPVELNHVRYFATMAGNGDSGRAGRDVFLQAEAPYAGEYPRRIFFLNRRPEPSTIRVRGTEQAWTYDSRQVAITFQETPALGELITVTYDVACP